MKYKLFEGARRLLRWFFGAPVQELPSEFGDPVPPELRAFKAKTEEIQHCPRGDVPPPPPVQHERTKPTR